MRTDLSQFTVSFIGEGETDWSGYSVSGAGDVDGDGYDDILIGAYYYDDGSYFIGKVYLIFGNASGGTMDIDLSNADASFIGKDANEYVGFSVSGVGDVNGDGYGDILFGSPHNSDGGTSAGHTHLILGKASGWARDIDISNADASFIGENAGDWSGTSVSGAGDVNGDGYDDFLIGAPENDDGGAVAGQTYLIFGKSSGWEMDTYLSNANASFWGTAIMDYSGYSVSGAGDVNGDGYDDILIGAMLTSHGWQETGMTYLIFGKSSGWAMDTTLNSATASFYGESIEDRSGGSVSGAGDVNGDGYDDILIGANENDDGGPGAGQTYLIFGKASGWKRNVHLANAEASFIGENAGDRSGYSVSSAGDVNGDGYDDILIGASHNSDGGQGAGQTYLILGMAVGWAVDTSLSDSDASFIGEDKVAYSGNSVSSAGDVNGDGYDDILIGAFGEDDMGINSGKTYLLLSYYDDDDDGVGNIDDAFPSNPNEYVDTDGDGMGDNLDPDMDGDGVDDLQDMFPLNATEWLDTDLDGMGNNGDDDDDNDGILDIDDEEPLNPLNSMDEKMDRILSRLTLMESTLIGRMNSVEVNIISRISSMNETVRSELAESLVQILGRMDDFDWNLEHENGSLSKRIQALEENLTLDLDHMGEYLDLSFELLRSYMDEINSTLGQGADDPINLTGIEEALDDLEKLDAIIEDLETIEEGLDVQQVDTDTDEADPKTYFIVMIVLLSLYTLILLVFIARKSGPSKKGEEKYYEE